MDKRAFTAIAISLVIWVAWQKFYLEPIQQQQQAALQAQQAQKAAAAQELKSDIDAKGILPPSERARLNVSAAPVEIKTTVLENAESKLVVSNQPWAVDHWELKGFANTLEKKDDKVTLQGATGYGSQIVLRFSDAAFAGASSTPWSQPTAVNNNTVATSFSSNDLVATRKVTLNQSGYGGQVEYTLKFLREPPKFVFLDLYGSPARPHDQEGSIFGQAPDKVHVTYRDVSGRHSHIASDLKEMQESAAAVRWLGLDTRYFVLAITPSQEEKSAGVQVVNDDARGRAVRGSLVFPTNGAKEMTISSKIYFGPKDMEQLKAVDPVLTDAIDFGWTSFLAVPLLQSLKWLYGYVHNYGVAIIILTFIIKMLLFPLTYKSMKSMAKISKLQPQLNALREKYKDDKEKLNVEMMNFMKTNGYNPIGGCLPILLQMPIFFALYRVLFNSMELYQAPFFGWIQDLSARDHFFVTPVLLTGLMYLQQKLSPNTATDPAQQKMLQIMPVMFGVFMLMLPSGLNIYMLVNSAVSIAQQWVLNKKLGIQPMGSAPVKA